MDPQTVDFLLRFAVPVATFAIGTLFSAQRNSASDAVVLLNELIADVKDLQNFATEYWVNDYEHKDSKINEARLKGLSFSISAIISQGIHLAPSDEQTFSKALDEIIDLSTGGTFEDHSRIADYGRAVDIRNKCAELIYLSRRERSRRNSPLAIIIDAWRWLLRSKLARSTQKVLKKIWLWPQRQH